MERIIGRSSNDPAAHFGEAVWYKPLSPSNRPGPLEERYLEGFYVGHVEGTSQSYILTPTGAVRCRAIRRRPDPEKWTQSLLECTASVLQPNALKPGETRVGVRAPVMLTRTLFLIVVFLLQGLNGLLTEPPFAKQTSKPMVILQDAGAVKPEGLIIL